MSNQVQYNNEMRGVLFPNDKQGNPARPDMWGYVTIHGIKYKLSGWTKTNDKGKLLSLAVTELETQTQIPVESDIPF